MSWPEQKLGTGYLTNWATKVTPKLTNDFKWYLSPLEKNGCGICWGMTYIFFPVILFCQVCALHLKFTSVMFFLVQLEFSIFWNCRARLSSHSSVFMVLILNKFILWEMVCSPPKHQRQCYLVSFLLLLKKASELSLSECWLKVTGFLNSLQVFWYAHLEIVI